MGEKRTMGSSLGGGGGGAEGELELSAGHQGPGAVSFISARKGRELHCR